MTVPEAYSRYISQILAIPKAAREVGVSYVTKMVEPIDFEKSPLSVVAFYLPQFHPIPENDLWWGPGFTEWTNVTKAVPQFVGHYQPHLPGELGFYDLRVDGTMKQQAELAKQYGVTGFCFHHYWFGGKRLLERPVKQFLEDRSINIGFCLCWANENWTRRWDGQENDVLLAQNHSPEDDLAFIDDLVPALMDSRYIRHKSAAVLIVYRVSLLPDARATAARWRERARQKGVGELYLVSAQTFGVLDPRPYGFDAAIEFPPHMAVAKEISGTLEVVNPEFAGQIYSYDELAASYCIPSSTPYPVIKTTSPSWDNEARKPGRGHIFFGSTPAKFGKWMREAADLTMQAMNTNPNQPPLMFVNAWNEWAEGAHLEPDRKFGYGHLHATANVLRNLIPADPLLTSVVAESQQQFRKRNPIAIILHLHYGDLFSEIAERISYAGDVDLFVSLRRDASPLLANRILAEFPTARLSLYENRGRDICPFLDILPSLVAEKYELACKVHGKKSAYRSDGDALRATLLGELLPSPEGVRRIAAAFKSDRTLGLMAPHRSLLDLSEGHRNLFNRNWLTALFERMGAGHLTDAYHVLFPAGSMFWFVPQSLRPLSELGLTPHDFEDEAGQIDGTLAHAIERIVGVSVMNTGYRMADTSEMRSARKLGSGAPTALGNS